MFKQATVYKGTEHYRCLLAQVVPGLSPPWHILLVSVHKYVKKEIKRKNFVDLKL